MNNFLHNGHKIAPEFFEKSIFGVKTRQFSKASAARPCPRILNKKSSHSTEWIKRHITDRYVQRAQEASYRSRASFKLLQLDDRFMFFRKNQTVVDLGCYPGGWSQVASERIYLFEGNKENSSNANHSGRLIGIDRLEMDPLPGLTFIKETIKTSGEDRVIPKLLEALDDKKADVVISDLAPQCVGIKQDDHLRSVELCISALEIAETILKVGGTFIVKIFMGSQLDRYKVLLKSRFRSVVSAKPRASRQESPEMFYVCKYFIGRPSISQEVQIKNPFSHKEGYY